MAIEILVVDDNDANLMLYERVMRRIPRCTTRCFSDPEAALEWTASNAPALVVVDYVMPGMNGVEFLRRFRSIPKRQNIPIVMLTGMNSGRLREQALEAGAAAFFPKPINKDRFVAEIQRLVDDRTNGTA